MKKDFYAVKTAFLAALTLLPAAAMLIFTGLLEQAAPAIAQSSCPSVGIVMYHSILASSAKCGKYIITPETLENDMIWLNENGYTTVSIADIEAYMDGRGTLPDKAVMLTFDDGMYNNLSYALPLLQKYDMCAVVSPIGRFADEFSQSNKTPNNNYSHATWAELGEMVASGRVEVLNHSYDLHGEGSRLGTKHKSGESDDKYRADVVSDIEKMQNCLRTNLGVECRFFTYPFGFMDETSEALLKEMGFSGSLSCYEHINFINRSDPDCLFGLGRYNRPYGISSSAFFKKIFR